VYNKEESKESRLSYIDAEIYLKAKVYCLMNKIEFKQFSQHAIIEKLNREDKTFQLETLHK
jgi:hypothetical protein